MKIETKFIRHNYLNYLLPSLQLIHNVKTTYSPEDWTLHFFFLRWHWYITFILNK